MSDHSLKRIYLLAFAVVLTAASVFAIEPGARYEAGFVYNAKTTRSTLFGGLTGTDPATKLVYELGDTWDWNGVLWRQLYPAHSPSARAAHAMAYDDKTSHIVLFGGRTDNAKTDLNDTWSWNGFDWTQINTADAPSPRAYSALAYDQVRDRFVLYGGAHLESDGKTVTTFRDTWEFDGTNWTHIGDNGPDVQKPKIAWDPDTNQMLMVAADASFNTHMYSYDPVAGAWNEMTPNPLPACISGASLVYHTDQKLLIVSGGVCSSATGTEDSMAWDGTKWLAIQATGTPGRLFDAASTYDAARKEVLLFGGAPALSVFTTITPIADLNVLVGPAWIVLPIAGLGPDRRSLATFATDPDRNLVWMFAGVNDVTIFGDLWAYQYGQWTRTIVEGEPPTCAGSGAYDTDRHKLVVICSDSSTFEFDGTTWTPAAPNDKPPARRFSAMAYDPALKKTVLVGGYDGTNYLNETWQWDGTNWVRQSNNTVTYRALPALWFDPKMQKLVLYGGIGRNNPQDRVTRFSDMWTFDSNGWTVLKPEPTEDVAVDGTPGMRYATQVAVNPKTNTVLLFGGLRIDRINGTGIDPNSPCTNLTCKSVYADDWWEWDGGTQTWTQKTYTSSPSARVNAQFAYDPSLDRMTLWGGAAATFFSDLWTLAPAGDTWVPRIISPVHLRPAR